MNKRIGLLLFLLILTWGASDSLAQNITYKTLGTWNSNGVPNYLFTQDTIPSNLVSRILAALPESKNLTTTHPEYLSSSNKINLTLKDSADVFVTFLAEGAGYRNALGFYTYPTNTPPQSLNDIKNNMTIIFPNSSASGSGGGLNAGNRVKIGTFGKNTTIGWFLVADGFVTSNATVGNGNWLLFSNTNLNPESDTTKRQHNVLLNDMLSQRIILGFEDIRRDNGSCDNDFNDVLFSVTANPITAIDTTGVPIMTDPTTCDIRVTKSVDNNAPQNNDIITYSVTAVNNGPANATGVKVSDMLPAGLVFNSANASKGSYDAASGLWTIGNLAKNESATLQIKAKVSQFTSSYVLGPASDFDLFSFSDVTAPSSDVEGRVAVGNNAYFSNYSIGYKLPVSHGAVDALIVNNNLTFNSGAVYGGNIVYGNVTNLPVNTVSINDGTLRKDKPVDFVAAKDYLSTLSTSLGGYSVNGTTIFQYSGLTLTGTDTKLNIFSVKAADLNAATSVAITVPNGAAAIVNISGTDIQWSGGLTVNGTEINNVLYNFPNAVNLKISGIDVRGSILAPLAQLDYNSGVINGQVIVNGMSGQGQINHKPFFGSIPVDNKIVNKASLTSVDQPDVNPGNDTSSVIIIVNKPSKYDVKVSKSASSLTPKHGDFVTYTISAINYGPGTSFDTKVTEILPAGLVFVSATPSKGSYVDSTGVWTIGSLSANESATLQLKVKVDLYSKSYNFGPAKGFNVFALHDINQPSADIEGKAAIGNNAYFSNYSVGDKLPSSGGTADVLIVNNNLQFTVGAVYSGNVVYGNATNLPLNCVSIIDGTLRKDRPIDFDAASLYLNNLSTTLSTYTVNGTTRFEWNGFTLEGNNALLNVFNVDGNNLTQANSMTINVPNGSVVVVNVSGSNVEWHGGLVVNGTAINNVVYNFPATTNLKISGIDVQGSILAPKAHLEYPAGVINGQVVAYDIYGHGQFNNKLFLGNIPLDSKITNNIVLGGNTVLDTNANNNFASATINAVTPATPNTGSDSTSVATSWTSVGTFPANEMVWTITTDQTGNMLVGTLGGKIFRTDDNAGTWKRINDDMNVAFIWSITSTTNNKLFAATEKGLYLSTNNGQTWAVSAFAGKDVRAISIDKNGSLYAGTWGYGIFKSTNGGSDWTDVTNNLAANAVHAITVNAQNEIFAGTFGAGIEKSTDGGQTWAKLNVGYDYIWALACSPTGALYAGTYGNGAYKSGDNGQTWSHASGLSSQFIYGVSVSPNGNNVYLCSWSSGVFVSTDAGSGWKTMGMAGFGPSASYFNPGSNALYVGTTDGKVYRAVDGTNAVNDGIKKLTFGLEQNYPNPFNPTTTIRYTIAEDCNVRLEVFNITGQLVRTLVQNAQHKGQYAVSFNASNLSSGMYIYRITAGANVQTRKLMLLK
ncbi:MAG: choice-of-anchor A family protein [Ignavibacteria bacterium]|nr:choice-of-anchor A family protein [Ignavibacteria bacterium]